MYEIHLRRDSKESNRMWNGMEKGEQKILNVSNQNQKENRKEKQTSHTER